MTDSFSVISSIAVPDLFARSSMKCLSIELSIFNIDVKTISPDVTKTQLFTSADVVTHPLYEGVIQKMLSGINQSTEPAEIAEEIYLAATDGADKLRYPACGTSKQIYAKRLEIGPEGSRKETTEWFLSLYNS